VIKQPLFCFVYNINTFIVILLYLIDINMRKSTEVLTSSLRFKDSILEEEYQEFRYQGLSSKGTITCIATINVVILVFLVLHIFLLSSDDTRFSYNLVNLIVFISVILAEAVLIMISPLRFLRGVIYIGGLSYIIFWIMIYRHHEVQ
jgi:hypothetical protein